MTFLLSALLITSILSTSILPQEAVAATFTLSDQASCEAAPFFGVWDGLAVSCTVTNVIITSVDIVNINIDNLVIDGVLINDGIINIPIPSQFQNNLGSTITNTGTINIFGVLENIGTLDNSGTINIFGDPTEVDAGLIIEGTVNNTGTINNNSAFIETLQTGIINNFGIINNQAPGSLIESKWTNEGTTNNSNLINNLLGIIENIDGATIDNQGTICGGHLTEDGTFTGNPTEPSCGLSTQLFLGDILVADGAGFLIKVDPITGDQALISFDDGSGNFFPLDVDVESTGDLITITPNGNLGPGTLHRVDPTTGIQTVLSAGGVPEELVRTVIEDTGDIVAVGGDLITRVDPVTGTQTVLFTGGFLSSILGIAIDSNGDFIVVDQDDTEVIRVNSITGTQTLISSNDLLTEPNDVAIDSNGNIIVLDDSGIFEVDPVTGDQMQIIDSSSLGGFPSGIIIDDNGDFIVTNIGNTLGHQDVHGVVKIDPLTGEMTAISIGGYFDDPTGIAIVTSVSLPQPTLKITETAIGGDGTFGFTITGPTPSTPSIMTISGTGMDGPNTVDPGIYSIQQSTIPTDWSLPTAICNDGSSTFSVDTVSGIVINPGDNIECEFINSFEGSTTPADQIQDLTDLITGLGLPNGVENSLLGPLHMAIALLEDGNPNNDTAVCGKLTAFLNQVDAKEGNGQLTAAQAQQLRDAVMAIQTSLGC